MGLLMYKEMDVITLNCIVTEPPRTVFDISINKNKIVQDDSRLEQLRDPDVSVDNVLDKEEVNEIQHVIDKIKNHFKDTDNNNIHVIVQGEYQINNPDDEDEDSEPTFSNVTSRDHLVMDNGGYNNIIGKDE
ncbi:1492_t:CDS:2 [Funneliformis mosseae]|uniref:1492_t:CDS:1 n=1 Tax=Funneliformis mosseae TaxID=27381 RepID=A0A9N9HGA9_FUNMO|nr:1492_t:CDS:2 [Funneliformis mosseae]